MNPIKLIKREPVMCAAFILAVISAFFVPPSLEYAGYIDFSTLCILFSLMAAVAGFKKCGVFDLLTSSLLKKVSTLKGISLVLILSCFFLSMLITNDVALITLVPLSIMTLRKANKEKHLIFIVVMQTIAANLGSMLTPFGNPQNLYLYNLSQMAFADFILLMLPLTTLSLVLILVCILVRKNSKISLEAEDKNKKINIPKSAAYLAFFLFCLLYVTKVFVFEWYWLLVAAVIFIAITDYKIFKEADYCLLLTFIFFFVFIGNIGKIETVSTALSGLVSQNEFITGVLSSQVISNVPAAILLSAFTDNYSELLLGVNAGGLGTLIASMASLISYKLYAAEFENRKGRYFAVFTVTNIIFLVIVCVFSFIFLV